MHDLSSFLFVVAVLQVASTAAVDAVAVAIGGKRLSAGTAAIGVQGGWSGLRKFRMGFPPVPAAAFGTEAARSSHVVGDFRAALGAEFLCHFGEVIELHDLAKLLCKIWGRIGQTNPKRCRKSGDFSRIPPCEICENSHERGRRSPGVRQKGCRVPPARVRAGSRSRRRRSGLPSRSCGRGRAYREPASWIRPRTVSGRHDGG